MKLITTLILALLSLPVYAADIASCSNPSGKGYFPETGIISAESSGWSDENISDGITKLSQLDNGDFDILFVDVRKEIISARQDGGHVMVLNSSIPAKLPRSTHFSEQHRASWSTPTRLAGLATLY